MAEAVAKEGGDPVRMNEFELLDELGKGSHGVVHKASWAHVRGHSTFVAIKTMNKKQLKRKRHFRKVAGRVQRTTELDSVKREIAVQRKLKHKNILQLIDVLEVNGSDELHLGECRGAPTCAKLRTCRLRHSPAPQCWSWRATVP